MERACSQLAAGLLGSMGGLSPPLSFSALFSEKAPSLGCFSLSTAPGQVPGGDSEAGWVAQRRGRPEAPPAHGDLRLPPQAWHD